MIGIVIVAHGGLAREYLSALEHIVGHHPGTVAVSIEPEDDLTAKQTEIEDAVASVDQGHGVVVVTDMFGGTPSNLACGACQREDRRVLYGANLPLLVKLAKGRGMSLGDAVAGALTAGRKYINSVDVFGTRSAFLAI